MLEQMKQARFVLSLLTGKQKLADLRKKIIEDGWDRNGPPPKYEDLPERDQKDIDKGVEALKTIQGVFDDVATFQAELTFKYFKALTKAGFTEEQATRIVAQQGSNIVKAG